MTPNELLQFLKLEEKPRRAVDDLNDQADHYGNACYSLDSMWRAVGEPEGQSPEDWLCFAEPLVESYAAYMRRLDEVRGVPEENRCQGVRKDVLFVLEREMEAASPWRQGDTMALHLLALAYCKFLDGVDFNG